jgi:hypothetical protein
MEVPPPTVDNLARAISQILSNRTELSISTAIAELIANPAELVKPTTRVNAIVKKVNEGKFENIFNIHHHMVAATNFFDIFSHFDETRAVIFGHKNQGKTQFLFFLVKLLQALGEGVVYLDLDISPPAEIGAAVTAEWLHEESENAVENLNVWGKQFTAFLQNKGEEATDVQTKLEAFSNSPTPMAFKLFIKTLTTFTKDNGGRVWMMADEAAKYDTRFRIPWPQEQKADVFHFVFTGSKGIASFVTNRSLHKWVWDLPVFSVEEVATHALQLCILLKLSVRRLLDELGVKEMVALSSSSSSSSSLAAAEPDDNNIEHVTQETSESLGERLEELFGGVMGYTVECILALNKGESLGAFLAQLKSGKSSSSVLGVMIVAANGIHNLESLCKAWFNLMKSPNNSWGFLCDVGLCDSGAPRGVILRYVIELIGYCYLPPTTESTLLNLVQFLQGTLTPNDAGFHGNLLELEFILLRKQGESFSVKLLSLIQSAWNVDLNARELLPLCEGRKVPPTLWVYTEENGSLLNGSRSTGWHLVELPTGFCVFDLLLVQVRNQDDVEIFGIQVTVSKKPFAKHATQYTCLERSKERVDKLEKAIQKLFLTSNNITYVMYAPNATGFTAPTGHDQPYYCFSLEAFSNNNDKSIKKRSSEALSPCCSCTTGNCSGCKCFKSKLSCVNCSSTNCSNNKNLASMEQK